MSATQFATVLTECIVPRAGRLPSDLAALDSECPMSQTLRHMGGQARVDRAHAHAIRTLIAAALRGE
jgi:hypothetical protein